MYHEHNFGKIINKTEKNHSVASIIGVYCNSGSLFNHSPKRCATNCPTIIDNPQIIWIGTVKTAQRHKKGPGQSPLIPQPNPKQKAPPTNCPSILEFFVSNTLFPSKLYYLFLMQVKVITFTSSPQPSTNINIGFQLSLIWRNWIMFSRRVMPEVINPTAKRIPTTNTTSWSFSCSQA